MHQICGKVFQNIQTKNIECFVYAPQQNYYHVVQNALKNGYQQSIFTSSIMIALIEEFLLKYDSIVTEIEFSVEDEELNQEIKKIIGHMKDNGAYWAIIKDKLLKITGCFAAPVRPQGSIVPDVRDAAFR